MHYPSHLQKLIESLKKLPGVGSKSAERFAFELLNWKEKDLQNLGQLMAEIPVKLNLCTECGCIRGEEACSFCQNRKNTETLCVIASPKEAFAIESTHEYKGYYHVLGGLLSPLEGIGPEQLPFAQLVDRIKKYQIQEVILALDSTLEGDATALYLKKELGSLSIQVSRLAFGMPMGSSIDYVDGGTLAKALSGRSKF